MTSAGSRNTACLQPATGLWTMYRPEDARYAFRATEADQASLWQAETRETLADRLGLSTIPSAPPEATVLEDVDKGDYTRRKLQIWTGPDTLMPVYLLLPEAADGPLPVVLALHGHGYGVKDIVGLREDGSERDTPEGYQKDFAVSICKAGFAVAAPELSCFGERRTDFSHINTQIGQGIPDTCAHTAMLAFHLGISVVGLRVHDAMCLLDYLETLDCLDSDRVGAMGISGGGMNTFFLTCLDQRIRACVVSGYYSTFRDSIHGMLHCACNYVPGLAEFGEMYDLVGLIAPRPMLVEAGSRDPIFPIGAVRKSVARARKVYGVFGARKSIQTDYFEGDHQISGHKAWEFLIDRLAAWA